MINGGRCESVVTAHPPSALRRVLLPAAADIESQKRRRAVDAESHALVHRQTPAPSATYGTTDECVVSSFVQRRQVDQSLVEEFPEPFEPTLGVVPGEDLLV